MPICVLAAVLLSVMPWVSATPPSENNRVQLIVDTSEADQVLDILAERAAGKAILGPQWQKLFATEPYRRLKQRETETAKRFNDRSTLTDEDFKQFVLSDSLLVRAAELRNTLERWKQADLQAAAESVLRYLPSSAVIHAKVYPVIKPQTNSFVWEVSTDPAIFLYLDPAISAAKFMNTVKHELHHIGLASGEVNYEKQIESLPERAKTVAEWTGAFGEGLAMLAAAGGPDVHPHAASSKEEQARWDHDMANFSGDLLAVNSFFLNILHGKFASQEAISEKASSFFGVQGPWYTVGYEMAVMVEKRFGRDMLIQTMLDPRKLLVLYNQTAAEQNARSQEQLPLWSAEILQAFEAK